MSRRAVAVIVASALAVAASAIWIACNALV
jgi:hypothetical protein